MKFVLSTERSCLHLPFFWHKSAGNKHISIIHNLPQKTDVIRCKPVANFYRDMETLIKSPQDSRPHIPPNGPLNSNPVFFFDWPSKTIDIQTTPAADRKANHEIEASDFQCEDHALYTITESEENNCLLNDNSSGANEECETNSSVFSIKIELADIRILLPARAQVVDVCSVKERHTRDQLEEDGKEQRM